MSTKFYTVCFPTSLTLVNFERHYQALPFASHSLKMRKQKLRYELKPLWGVMKGTWSVTKGLVVLATSPEPVFHTFPKHSPIFKRRTHFSYTKPALLFLYITIQGLFLIQLFCCVCVLEMVKLLNYIRKVYHDMSSILLLICFLGINSSYIESLSFRT